MERIRNDRIGQGPIGKLLDEKIPSLGSLPEELPSPSYNKPSPNDFARLLLPEGTDLSRVPTRHPLSKLFRNLWLKITIQAASSVPPQEISSPKEET